MHHPETNPFQPEVVAAVVAHMNDDHGDDSIVICKVFGGRPDATHARMVGLDGHGAEFDVDGPAGPARVRVAWSRPISQRPEIREEVARMYNDARSRLDEG